MHFQNIRPRSKQKSQALIIRLKKQLLTTQRTLARLHKELPLYLSLSDLGWNGLQKYAWELEALEEQLKTFPDDNSASKPSRL